MKNAVSARCTWILSLTFWLLVQLIAQGAAPGLVEENLRAIDDEVAGAIRDGNLPGGVVWLERQGIIYQRAYGQRSIVPTSEAMSVETIFDVASLTKVIATSPSIMLLIESGKIALDQKVNTYLSEFNGGDKDEVTIRHLLTHTSGLSSGLDRSTPWSGYATGISNACSQVLQSVPGSAFTYNDINFILLGEIVRRVSGQPLNEFARDRFYLPLRMLNTTFLPSTNSIPSIAPTEQVEGSVLRGVVHDPTSRRMGGVTGHAGLFTTAGDLARFCRMMINGGILEGARVLKRQTVEMMTKIQSPAGLAVKRGLGWDIDSPYSSPRGTIFPIGSYGHTGWTGGSVWIDPGSETFVVFLSNHIHPIARGSVVQLRRRLGTLGAKAAGLDLAGSSSNATP